jgi:23S rRNA (cytosine1962-C5)-methyltransferase
MESDPLSSHLPALKSALDARSGLIQPPYRSAIRLFTGFYEGWEDLVVDLYGATLLLWNYADRPEWLTPEIQQSLIDFYRQHLPFLRAVWLKTRQAPDHQRRIGALIWGERPDRRIQEHGVWYAIDLGMHQDASFYLDTRNLRLWLKEHVTTETEVLNTFAYTGSLGVACLAGGAARVVQVDINRQFLNLAKDSYSLNGLPIIKGDFQQEDFFHVAARMRRNGSEYDTVIIDPPFFSRTAGGEVNLVEECLRVINKARPLVRQGGWLIAVNNALFLSGKDYYTPLKSLCADGYPAIEELLDVPEDITGYTSTRINPPPVDPSPFNHPTKIAILRVLRKKPLR